MRRRFNCFILRSHKHQDTNQIFHSHGEKLGGSIDDFLSLHELVEILELDPVVDSNSTIYANKKAPIAGALFWCWRKSLAIRLFQEFRRA